MKDTSSPDALLLVGRILMGVIFLTSGLRKLMDVGAFAGSLEKQGVPLSSFLATLAGLVETLGGLAVIVGFQTRYAAGLMVLFVIVATLIAHRFWELSGPQRAMQQTQFMKNLAIIGGFLFLTATGPGRFSLDRLWKRPAGAAGEGVRPAARP